MVRARQGSITLRGERIDGLTHHRRSSRRGSPWSPRTGGSSARCRSERTSRSAPNLRNDKAGIQTDIERVFTMFPRLKERIAQRAGTLSGGEQQMLAIGRALMARPYDPADG